MENERKLVTVENIQEIKSIENSDNLEYARIRDWWVVVNKNIHQIKYRKLH